MPRHTQWILTPTISITNSHTRAHINQLDIHAYPSCIQGHGSSVYNKARAHTSTHQQGLHTNRDSPHTCGCICPTYHKHAHAHNIEYHKHAHAHMIEHSPTAMQCLPWSRSRGSLLYAAREPRRRTPVTRQCPRRYDP